LANSRIYTRFITPPFVLIFSCGKDTPSKLENSDEGKTDEIEQIQQAILNETEFRSEIMFVRETNYSLSPEYNPDMHCWFFPSKAVTVTRNANLSSSKGGTRDVTDTNEMTDVDFDLLTQSIEKLSREDLDCNLENANITGAGLRYIYAKNDYDPFFIYTKNLRSNNSNKLLNCISNEQDTKIIDELIAKYCVLNNLK
jgi:hypothetical protein